MFMFKTYNKLVQLLDRICSRVPFINAALQRCERQFNVKRLFVLHVFVLGSLTSLTMGMLNHFIFYGVAFSYPCIKTLQSSTDPNAKERWFRYWVVLGFIFPLVTYFHFVLELLPFCNLLRLLLIFWCQAPIVNNGSTVIYDLIRPLTHIFQYGTFDDVCANLIGRMIPEDEQQQQPMYLAHTPPLDELPSASQSNVESTVDSPAMQLCSPAVSLYTQRSGNSAPSPIPTGNVSDFIKQINLQKYQLK